jgi:membrane-bound inhibitor of C-type lysozyme
MKLAYRATSVCLGICGLAIVGCATGENPQAEGNQATFTCPTGETIEAVFPTEVDGEVIVTLPDQETVSLPRVESASGAKYSDGTTTFWEKGGEALVEQNGEVVLQGCTAE